ICITILYHNLHLFIDIFHIKRCYLCLFICFCMLGDSWRMNCGSWDSNGKRGVLMQFREDQKIPEKLWKIIFSQKTKEARREGGDGPLGAHTPQARATPGRSYRGCGPPGPPLAPPCLLYLLLETLKHGEQRQKDSAASVGRK